MLFKRKRVLQKKVNLISDTLMLLVTKLFCLIFLVHYIVQASLNMNAINEVTWLWPTFLQNFNWKIWKKKNIFCQLKMDWNKMYAKIYQQVHKDRDNILFKYIEIGLLCDYIYIYRSQSLNLLPKMHFSSFEIDRNKNNTKKIY